METFLELTAHAVAANVPWIRRLVARAAGRAGASRDLVHDVTLCAGEAVANAARHAYGDGRGPVHVVVRRDEDVLTLVVRDDGKGLGDPRDADSGGFGLRIIWRLAHDLELVLPSAGGTELRMGFPLEEIARGSSAGRRRHARV
jgi:anti-sigma regulatory factor (Ser/Thr protein kinase)